VFGVGPGATKTSYRLVKADVGKPIAVTVTGIQSNGPAISASSAAVTILKRLTSTPRPSIKGGNRVRSVVTARVGRWRPNGVSLTFQWSRNGVPIAGATGTSYQLVPGDVRQRITVTVTGSLAGYITVAKTSSAIRPRN